jgi:cytochrome c556
VGALQRARFRKTMVFGTALEGAAMQRRNMLVLPAIVAAVAACSDPSADQNEPRAEPTADALVSPNAEPGWTGLTEPGEVIEARRVLMIEAERLMKPIDSFLVGEPADAALLHENATSLEALLLALPHLFPPTTNLFDPSAHDPPTTALPTIWQRFPAFLTFAESAERAAAALRDANDTEALSAAGARLRGACDTCHASFMKPYTPPQTQPEDFEFDFESVLPKE